MSNNEVADIQAEKKQQNKNPLDNAVNKLKEGITKDTQNKINDTIKNIHETNKALGSLKEKFRDLIKQKNVEDAELAALLKELK